MVLAIGVAGVRGLAACGGPQRNATGDGSAARESSDVRNFAPGPQHDGAGGADGEPPAADTRTPIEKRRDAGCDQLGPKLTACAVADAKANLAAGKIGKQQFERDTAPEIQRKNTQEFLKACKGATYSSRQVRVLEVCFHEETQCAPLLDCLGHLSDRDTTKGRGAK